MSRALKYEIRKIKSIVPGTGKNCNCFYYMSISPVPSILWFSNIRTPSIFKKELPMPNLDIPNRKTHNWIILCDAGIAVYLFTFYDFLELTDVFWIFPSEAFFLFVLCFLTVLPIKYLPHERFFFLFWRKKIFKLVLIQYITSAKIQEFVNNIWKILRTVINGLNESTLGQ